MTKNKSKSKFRISFRTVLSLLTFILVIYVVYANFNDIKEAVSHIGETNILVLLMLIPEQLFMYFCCGQMFFSYMAAKKNAKTVSPWTLMQVSLELNFVNHAVPAGGLGGLGYITWRLKPFGATAGQASFMYVLRYVITVCANQFQTIVAIIALLIIGGIPTAGAWVIGFTALMSVSVIAIIAIAVAIASSQKRIDWFAKTATNFTNWLVEKVTFGHKKQILKRETVDKYFGDAHDDLMTARHNKKMLIKPILWGIVYSFLEIATYWIVAASLGRPDVLPQIMIGEAIGSVMGAIVPYGLYELGMVGIMASLGVDAGFSTIVVLMTRVIVLASTIISGYGFYQHSISKIGKKERKEMTGEQGGNSASQMMQDNSDLFADDGLDPVITGKTPEPPEVVQITRMLPGVDPRQVTILSVSRFLNECNTMLEADFGDVIIEGEVASFKINQGKWVFFDLKEGDASVNCFMVLSQLSVPIQDGMKVRVRATPKVTRWGRFSLTIHKILPIGEGNIKKSLEMLKKKLQKEGLFDPKRKRPIRPGITKIGVISSVNAAGYIDFLKILDNRWGGLQIFTINTMVQGLNAPEQICRALDMFNERGQVEVIAILRGGGSADDLSAFNDEALARKIAASKIPVMTGIGHEIDESLADLVADVRASTPSNAAERLSFDRKAVYLQVQREVRRAGDGLKNRVNILLREVVNKTKQVKSEILHRIELKSRHVGETKKILATLNPENVLKRGYAIITGNYHDVGQDFELLTEYNKITAEVKNIEPRKEKNA